MNLPFLLPWCLSFPLLCDCSRSLLAVLSSSLHGSRHKRFDVLCNFLQAKNPLRLTQNAFFCAIAPCSWFFTFSLLSHRLRLTPFPLRLGGGLCRASTARAHARAARRSGGRRDSQAKRACPRR